MKNIKKLSIITLALMLVFILAGCNRQIIDITYSYDEAIVGLPNGEVIDGKISSWKDYEDGDQIQVVVDGTTYLVHSSQIVLIKK